MLIAFIIWTGLTASAQSLTPFPQGPKDLLPVDTTEPAIACDQISQRLQRYNQMARQHDQSLIQFFFQIEQKLNEWHAVLLPLETTSQTLPAGTFAPLQAGASEISNVAFAAADNAGLLAAELDLIMYSMESCTLAPKSNVRLK